MKEEEEEEDNFGRKKANKKWKKMEKKHAGKVKAESQPAQY